MNGIKERWDWIRTHWILIAFVSITLYVLPFIQTQWAVHGYPGFLGFLNPAAVEEPCVPGIVVDGYVSDSVLYQDLTQSSHQDGLLHFYTIILHDDGSFSAHEVSKTKFVMIRPWARWNCEGTTWSNRWPMS